MKIGAPFPFPERLAATFMAACDRVLVIEETDTVIEYFLRNGEKVLGRLSGHVPSQGELVPQVIAAVIDRCPYGNGSHPPWQRRFKARRGPGTIPRSARSETDPVRRLPAPCIVFCHQKGTAQSHFHLRYRLLHPRHEPWVPWTPAWTWGPESPWHRDFTTPFAQDGGRAADRGHHGRLDLLPFRDHRLDQCRLQRRSIHPGHPGQRNHGHDRYAAEHLLGHPRGRIPRQCHCP